MPMFKIDQNAWQILQQTKELMRKEGIAAPSHSDAIRWLWQKVKHTE